MSNLALSKLESAGPSDPAVHGMDARSQAARTSLATPYSRMWPIHTSKIGARAPGSREQPQEAKVNRWAIHYSLFTSQYINSPPPWAQVYQMRHTLMVALAGKGEVVVDGG